MKRRTITYDVIFVIKLVCKQQTARESYKCFNKASRRNPHWSHTRHLVSNKGVKKSCKVETAGKELLPHVLCFSCCNALSHTTVTQQSEAKHTSDIWAQGSKSTIVFGLSSMDEPALCSQWNNKQLFWLFNFLFFLFPWNNRPESSQMQPFQKVLKVSAGNVC